MAKAVGRRTVDDGEKPPAGAGGKPAVVDLMQLIGQDIEINMDSLFPNKEEMEPSDRSQLEGWCTELKAVFEGDIRAKFKSAAEQWAKIQKEASQASERLAKKRRAESGAVAGGALPRGSADAEPAAAAEAAAPAPPSIPRQDDAAATGTGASTPARDYAQAAADKTLEAARAKVLERAKTGAGGPAA